MSRDLRMIWRSAALDRTSPLTGTERLAVAVLAEHLNGDDGSCHPSLATLGAEMGGLSARHARRIVRSLQAKGWVRIHQQAGGASTYRPRLQHVTTPDTGVPGTPDMGVPGTTGHPGHDPGHDPGHGCPPDQKGPEGPEIAHENREPREPRPPLSDEWLSLGRKLGANLLQHIDDA